jgi:beta-lactam-binding protein with PASTA domain
LIIYLGLSIYLASVIGYLPLPGVVPTLVATASQEVVVPDLIHKAVRIAEQIAKQSGLIFVVDGGVSSGIVSRQSIPPGDIVKRGSTILVAVDGR